MQQKVKLLKAMKPHQNMTPTEEKAYLDYVFSHDLSPDEKAAYREWIIQAEEDYGCDFSVVPIEILRQGQEASDAYYEKFLEERRERNAAKTETAQGDETIPGVRVSHEAT